MEKEKKKSSMKIAVVSHDNFWPLKGGGGIRVFWVVKTLLETGHHVKVFAPVVSTTNLPREIENAEIVKIGSLSRFSKKKEFEYFIFMLKVFFNLLKREFDIIYAHNIIAAFPSYIVSKLRKKPIIFDMDDIITGLSSFGPLKKYGKFIEIYIARKSDMCIVMSEALKEVLTERGVSHIQVVMHGVDLKKYTPQKNKKIYSMIYIGGMEYHDGVDIVPEALINLIKDYPNVKVLMIGDGRYRSKLMQDISRLKLKNYFTFINWIDHDEIPKYLSEAKIGIVTHRKSLSTDIALVLKGLEYMAMELPVVAPDLKGMREEIGNNERGLLFRPENTSDFAEKISFLLKNPDIIEKMGKKGRKFVERNCNWRKNARKIVEICEKIKN